MFKTYEFISPKVVYECPLCGKKYSTYDESKKCIEKHSIPESIIFYNLMSEKSNCPIVIYVQLNDGREAKYVFAEITKEKGGEDDDIA